MTLSPNHKRKKNVQFHTSASAAGNTWARRHGMHVCIALAMFTVVIVNMFLWIPSVARRKNKFNGSTWKQMQAHDPENKADAQQPVAQVTFRNGSLVGADGLPATKEAIAHMAANKREAYLKRQQVLIPGTRNVQRRSLTNPTQQRGLVNNGPLHMLRGNVVDEARRQWHERCNLPDGTSTTIPKMIHQSWRSADRIPARFQNWMQSWLVFNPDWKYVFWDDLDNKLLINVFFPQFAATFKSLGSGVAQADFSRYALLYQFGGVYADTDFECKSSFSDLIDRYEGFLSSEPRIHAKLLEHRDGVFVCNAILASRPQHPFWMAVMNNIRDAVSITHTDDPVSLTGPRRVHQVYFGNEALHAGIELLPEEYFYPEFAQWNKGNLDKACHAITDFNRLECQQLQDHPNGLYTNNTHAVHHWECTWCRGDRTDAYLSIGTMMATQHVIRPFNRSNHAPSLSNLLL